MQLLKFYSSQIDPADIVGDDLLLRAPRAKDYAQWSKLRRESKDFLQPWEPLWDPAEGNRSSFRNRLRRYQAELKSGRSVALFIFVDNGSCLVGGLTLSNIRRGVAHTCTLGYWMGEEYAGKGIMGRAVRLVIPFVFNELKLHRLEAASIESNSRSTALLENCGFVFEGCARHYLKINGKWQDHLLFALLASDPG